jgi:hypothetical protein
MSKQSIHHQLLCLIHSIVKAAALGLIGCMCLVGCSSQQLYNAGQAWQQNQCNRIEDAAERNRCMASTKTSYDDYQREAEAAKR